MLFIACFSSSLVHFFCSAFLMFFSSSFKVSLSCFNAAFLPIGASFQFFVCFNSSLNSLIFLCLLFRFPSLLFCPALPYTPNVSKAVLCTTDVIFSTFFSAGPFSESSKINSKSSSKSFHLPVSHALGHLIF